MMTEHAEPAPHEAPLPEGEEQAPRGTRTMGIVRWALVGLMAVAAAGAWIHHATTSGVLAETARFHCPMHPTVVQPRQGECPICGMDLVPVPAGSAKGATAAATAVPAAAPGAPAAATQADAPRYACPMHCDPAFVTADPKARCPVCGMKLVPVEAAAPAAALPGLATVELTVDRIQLMGMRTATAVRAPLASTLHTVGFVTAPEGGLVSVTARFSGWVESLGAAETGQLVEKGQVLANIYSPEMLNAQQVFLNALRWSGGRGAAAVPTAAPQVASDLERDARQRLELLGVAAQDIDALARAATVGNTVHVRSPVRGYLARRGVLRGLYVQPGTELFQVADLSRVWVLADVHETEIGRIKVGQQAALTVAAWPGETFTGRLTFIYPAMNTGSRTLQARLELGNARMKLRPGMYGEVALEVGASAAVVVPREALVDTGELQYVFVSRGGGRFEPRRVEPGLESEGRIAILSGLAEGETVVTTSAFLLDSESRLRAALTPAH
jgi:membrane fusion protein, copper/silver efflux system